MKTSAEWREITKANGWPDPPPGNVDVVRWVQYTQDLWTKVDGQWFYSRDGKHTWQPSHYGPRV